MNGTVIDCATVLVIYKIIISKKHIFYSSMMVEQPATTDSNFSPD